MKEKKKNENEYTPLRPYVVLVVVVQYKYIPFLKIKNKKCVGYRFGNI